MEEKKKQTNIDELAEKLAACEKLRDEYLAGWQRQKADFLNFQKEQTERLKRAKEEAQSDIVRAFLPFIDNIERALAHIPEDLKTNEWAKGVGQIYLQLKNFLKSVDIEEVAAEGEEYNPEFHEAVELVENKDASSGIICEVVQKGYARHGKLIRPAKVKVVK